MSLLFIQYLPEPGTFKHFTFINFFNIQIWTTTEKVITREERIIRLKSDNRGYGRTQAA